MLAIRPQRVREQDSVMVGEMPVERPAQLNFVCFTWIGGTPRIRIHGRPRSDRKRSFLLSAVAPSTSTRHPREARPINWAQRGGLASGRGNVSLTPRPHFTAHHARLVTRWFVLRTALLFVRSAVRLVYANSRTSVTAPDGVAALTAAGYQVFAINPLAVTRYRDRNVSAQLTGRVHVFLTCAIPGIE